MAKANLYSQLSQLTYRYFDSRYHSFIDELIEYHVNIEPEKIKSSQLIDILDWIEIAAYLINENQKTVNKYINNIKRLAENS